MQPDSTYRSLDDLNLVALCNWREASNQIQAAKYAQVWSVKNRVQHPTWWGHTWREVILDPWQFSSFNKNDVNTHRWPKDDEPSWLECIETTALVFNNPEGNPDSTSGATSYFDKSLDHNPPKWAVNGSNVHTLDVGSFHFFRRTQD